MTNDEKMGILKLIFNTIFQSKAQNTDITQVFITTNLGNFPGRWFINNTLRGFDVDINLGDRTIKIRCIEQNPNKTDNFGNLKKYANLARQGHKIMWVIDREGDAGFLGRIQDGEWNAAFTPATQAYQQPAAQYQQPGAAQPQYQQPKQPPMQQQQASQTVSMNIDDLPEIPNGADIPDYILESIAEMDEPLDWGDYE